MLSLVGVLQVVCLVDNKGRVTARFEVTLLDFGLKKFLVASNVKHHDPVMMFFVGGYETNELCKGCCNYCDLTPEVKPQHSMG